MKRPGSSDSHMSINEEDKGWAFPPIVDGLDDDSGEAEELGGGRAGTEKKRRLSGEQVRALEKNFEVENKLDPERKMRLARELGLQPRQVAVWFQNRRARWKTKQLERGYGALKASYDALRLDFDALRQHNQSLLAEIKDVKAKLGDEESSTSVKEEPAVSEAEEEPPALIYKDGSSDSDSSAILNDDTTLRAAASNAVTANLSPPSLVANEPRLGFGFSFQHQLMKAEEEDEFEEPCTSFFADEQAPTLPWCYSDHWSWMDGAGGGDSNAGRREGALWEQTRNFL